VVSFMSQPLYPHDKSIWYPIYRRMGGPQGQSGCSVQEKRAHHCPCWELNPSHLANRCLYIKLLDLRETNVHKTVMHMEDATKPGHGQMVIDSLQCSTNCLCIDNKEMEFLKQLTDLQISCTRKS